MRDVAKHLHGGIEHGLGRPPHPGEHAEDEADAAADEEALEGALGRDRGVGEQGSVAERLPEGDRDVARRRQDAGGEQAGHRRDLPDDDEPDRQGPGGEAAEQRARDLPAATPSRRRPRRRPDLVGDGLAERARC